MTELDALVAVLEESSARSPEKPLTNTHLLNICKMARRYRHIVDERTEAAFNEAMSEDRKWGV